MFSLQLRRRQAMSRLISDEELHDIMHKKDNGSCSVCFEVTSLHDFMNCAKHGACKSCLHHASLSGITSCAMCPKPEANYHVQCPSCLNKFFSDSINCKCNCGHAFTPKLSRIFKRGPHTYTNFLDEKDKLWLKNQFNQYGGCVWCPTCGIGLQRSEACNELYHCGIEKVCACCGQFNFRHEQGMVQHRKESGCASYISEDRDIKGNEHFVTREKLRQNI